VKKEAEEEYMEYTGTGMQMELIIKKEELTFITPRGNQSDSEARGEDNDRGEEGGRQKDSGELENGQNDSGGKESGRSVGRDEDDGQKDSDQNDNGEEENGLNDSGEEENGPSDSEEDDAGSNDSGKKNRGRLLSAPTGYFSCNHCDFTSRQIFFFLHFDGPFLVC
jgi:hypothetical protein